MRAAQCNSVCRELLGWAPLGVPQQALRMCHPLSYLLLLTWLSSVKAALVLIPKHCPEYWISQCFATEFCQGSSGEGEEMRAAFGAVPAFTPTVCHAFFISDFLGATPEFASPREEILTNDCCPLGQSCVGGEVQVALGCLQFAP